MLKSDHRTVEALFKRFEKAGDGAHAAKKDLVARMIEALSVHAAIEEQVFYPVVRATVSGAEDMTLESLEEHHIVKWVLSELESMSPEEERFDAKVTVLIENVRHHVEEEEQDLFPKVRDELGRASLHDLGDALTAARRVAPTHPHPRSPDEPPGSLLIGTAAGVADRVGDTVSGLAQGYAAAVGDLVATFLGRRKPRAAASGSKAARNTAKRTRAATTDSAMDVIRTARDTGERTLRRSRAAGSAAASGAKRTATSGARGASETARTARSAAKATATTARKSSARTAKTAKQASTSTAKAAGTSTSKRASGTTAKRASSGTSKRASTASKRTGSAAKTTRSSAKKSSR